MSYTIRDIAERAGVSKSTVSRYIKGERNKVSSKTQKIIEGVIKELDYRPNQMAVGLARRQAPQVGVVMSDIGNPFSSVAMRGIFDACTERNHMVSFALSNGSLGKEREGIKNLLSFNIDRLIINTCGGNDDFLDELDPAKTVVIDRPLAGRKFHTVTSDNFASTYAAIERLQSNGCESIAFITPDIDSVTTRQLRYQGYLAAVQGKQKAALVSYTSQDDAFRQLDAVFASGSCNGAFTVNGEALKVLLRYTKSKGVRIGRDIGVVSFEDWDWMGLTSPTITAVKQDSYKMGYYAAKDLLDGDLGSQNLPNIRTICSALVERESDRVEQ
ncbi:LacI family DNA-binding transcriptional regulator [Bifidobacterium sp.]|jgi:LacI family kdg operon repressor|uniref:LacI family DNA-binding transcriptional regulator n=1 Tax=Bifidobacterium sp. TaxID=41200 RepID=UPI0025C415A2|nr:LacI family DNA-binding transcriptional regulator [Bifidobacterium sp.]MCH4160007.1 LacI family transcriptional regulator [Bifidobacterium sp.]MCH4174856.1 LacI family transcriptional regulator [Bifidobacterium sp.]MCI1634977.1 LacI family transcriptional regulator [Bifidobacterium sp.]